MKKLVLILVTFGLAFLLIGCEESAESQQERETEKILKEINNQVGMPDIINFYEKKLAKEIFELRDRSDLVTYAYTQNLEGQFVYLGEAVGFGLPYSVQYTNPEQYNNGTGTTLPQADPNGLYMPDGLSATWLMLINPDTGKPEIIYTEPTIVVTQSKLPARLVAPFSLTEDY